MNFLKKRKVFYAIITIVIIILIAVFISYNFYLKSSINKLNVNTKSVIRSGQNFDPTTEIPSANLISVGGNIYVNFEKKYPGILGISANNTTYSLQVFPEISANKKSVNFYAITYYSPKDFNSESLANFSNEVAEHSDYLYITLINKDNPKEGVSIIPGQKNTIFTFGPLADNNLVIENKHVGVYNEKVPGGIHWYTLDKPVPFNFN
ncbi:MAG: hypothetical protein ACRC41_01415 [Sarcina sp.]